MIALRKPVVEEAYNAGDSAPTPWSEGRDRLEAASTYWLATVHPDGRPHVVPVLAVWVDDALHFVASPSTRKAGDLARDPRCAVTTTQGALDLVIEGDATRVSDHARLLRVAVAYASKYQWHVNVRDGAFHAEGAPTAGPPPYEVYEITQTVVFGFPTDGTLIPTRWRFDHPHR